MELRHLHYFIAVAEELHFTRAAERLHLAQPALSQQIKRLETELAVELFRRTSRRVELTDAGKVFLTEARAAVEAAERAVASVRRAARGEFGWLRVGFVGSAAYGVLPRLLQNFITRWPDVHLELDELTTERQIVQLAAGEIDVGIARELREEEGLSVKPLLREPLVLALPTAHPLARRRRLRLAEVAREPLILFPRAEVPRLHDLIVSLYRAAGLAPRTTQEAVQFPTILGLVSAGVGIALVPATVQALRQSGVAYVPLLERGAVTELVLASRPDRESAALRQFVNTALVSAGNSRAGVG